MHLVGVKDVIGKGPEVFQKSRIRLKNSARQNGDLEQVTYRRHESISRHLTKFGLPRLPGARDLCSPVLDYKVKCTLVRALRLCTGRTAHIGSRGIALLFHDHDTRSG